MTFSLAIIGRPNVGKSTLFNRLTGTRHALVDDMPGVTRDVREGDGRLGPLMFRVLDTAGLDEAKAGSLAARMSDLSLRALSEADVALMVVDARAGITPTDRHFADLVRRSGKPAVLAVNKAEGKLGAEAVGEAYALGLGEPVPISAEHGEGMADLYAALAAFEVKEEEPEVAEEHGQLLSVAITGRPNAGKSTLINHLLGSERVLTGPEAGITRDAIAIPFDYHGRAISLVDTAGIRRRANVTGRVEKMSVADALRAIGFAQVVVLMMDATLAFEKQDLQIASLAEREGRAVVLAVNKWDLVPKASRKVYLESSRDCMETMLPQLSGVPMVCISAKDYKGLDKLMEAVFAVYETWNKRITTGQLNRWLEGALARHAPPLIKGRRLKIRYLTQTKARPPTFTLFANVTEVPAHYARYLVGSLRDTFELQGVPIRLKVKKNKNPYEK